MEKWNNNNRLDQNQYKKNNYYNNIQSSQRKNQSNLNPDYNCNNVSQSHNYNLQNPNSAYNLSHQITVNNIRNSEAPNMYYKNKPFEQTQNKKEISRMTEYNKGEKPLWSLRETTYDEFKEPRNTETVTTNKIYRKSNLVESAIIPKKNNLEELQEMDKKYFNNVKYKKVKVTKKVKNEENNVHKKGPEDDYEQKYSIQNYNNQNQYNNGFIYNNQNQYNKNEYNENDDNNDYLMNNEQDNNNIHDLSGKLDNNDINKNDNNENDEEFQNILNNNINNNYEELNLNNEELQNHENEAEKDNYQLDLDQLEETNSIKNQQEEENEEEEEYMPQLKNNNNEIDNNINIQRNNNYQNNNQVNPRPSFIETTTQKVNDNIDQIIVTPEANLEKWNLIADYIP